MPLPAPERGGRVRAEASYAPFRGRVHCRLFPTAYAVGYFLTPLRGLSRTQRFPAFSGLTPAPSPSPASPGFRRRRGFVGARWRRGRRRRRRGLATDRRRVARGGSYHDEIGRAHV